MEREMKQVLADCKKLGIINIEASGNLTPDFIAEAVKAVKEIPLDFDAIAEQMEEERKAFSK